MRTKGKITKWNDEKGFGFLKPSAGDKEVFVHISEFNNRNRRPKLNELVTYSLATDKHGRPRAVHATLPGDKRRKTANQSRGAFSTIVSIIFFVIVGITVLDGQISPIILAVYLVASLLSFFMYAMDKSAAQRGAWRTSESTLHLISLVGGWPGALVAQQKLRHKSKKQSFRFVFWVTAVLNCGAFVWLLTPNGSAMFHSFLEVLQGLTTQWS